MEIDEEEGDFKEILVKEEEDEEMEEETECTDPLTTFPMYVPLWKEKKSVRKDLDESKSSLQTPLLPNDIISEGVHLGQVPSLNFED